MTTPKPVSPVERADSAREVIARWLAGRRFTRTPASTQAYRRYLADYRAMLSAAEEKNDARK